MKRHIAWTLFVAFVAFQIELKGWSKYQENAYLEMGSAILIGAAMGLAISFLTRRRKELQHN
jgi:hypothetical protein